jgi:hypothetical protein
LVLDAETVQARFPGLTPERGAGGGLTPAQMAINSTDPNDTGDDLTRAGLVAAQQTSLRSFLALFSDDQRGDRPFSLDNTVAFFRTGQEARAFTRKQIADLSRFLGTDLGFITIVGVEEIEGPALGDESSAFQVTARIIGRDFNANASLIWWSRGPVSSLLMVVGSKDVLWNEVAFDFAADADVLVRTALADVSSK